MHTHHPFQRIRRGVTAALAVLAVAVGVTWAHPASGAVSGVTWSASTPTGFKALDDSMGAMVGGVEYIFGGYTSASGSDIVYSNAVYTYDTSTGTWTKLTVTLPKQTVCPYGDDGTARLTCSGNRGGTTPPALCPFDEWNQPSGSTQTDPTYPADNLDNEYCRVDALTHTAVVADGTDIYLIGGRAGVHGCSKTANVCDDVVYATTGVWRFDTTTDTFKTTTPQGASLATLPDARGSGAAWITTDVDGNRWLRFVAGYTDGFHAVDSTYAYAACIYSVTCSPGVWSYDQPLPSASDSRSHFPVDVVGNTAYIFGGQTGDDSTHGAEVGPVGSPEYCGGSFTPNPSGTATCTPSGDSWGDGSHIVLRADGYKWTPGDTSWTASPPHARICGFVPSPTTAVWPPRCARYWVCVPSVRFAIGGTATNLHDHATKVCFDYDTSTDSWSTVANSLPNNKYTGVGGVVNEGGTNPCHWFLIGGAPLSTSDPVDDGTLTGAIC